MLRIIYQISGSETVHTENGIKSTEFLDWIMKQISIWGTVSILTVYVRQS